MKQPTKFSDIICAIGPAATRDAISIMLPKPLDKKTFDALQHTVSRTVQKFLTSRRRRHVKRK